MAKFELFKGPYNPQQTEQSVLDFWGANSFFKPEYNSVTKVTESVAELKDYLAKNPDQKYVIIDPPPNAYGRPHLGNISGYAYQDLMGRFWRMKGKRVLLFPGKDHAGIQGEIVVLREFFRQQGKSKANMTREQFYKETYDYFTDMMAAALEDEKRIGLSADFDRNVFTLDPAIVDNVLTTFKKLYEDDKVYKGVRIVNWCPSCKTALADIDTEKKEREASMYYLKYPLKEKIGDIEYITVATTRPETMLGDTAVVVDPKDERYKSLHGKIVVLPLVNREIPIITDGQVDMTVGTGGLKLTPAHAPEDYEIMLRWNEQNPNNQVDWINVVDPDGKLCGPVGKYAGMTTEEAKTAVIEAFKELGLFEKEETISQRIPVCERCKTIIQPLMSSQWFIKVDDLKAKAVDAVKTGEITIHPKYMTKKYYHWMKNLRDWPISRALWWGYRFPGWYKGDLETSYNADGKVIEKIGGIEIGDFSDAVTKGLAQVSLISPGDGWLQDENVFDTWFSSGQWPYVTLEKEGLLDTMYPTNTMETGYDILEFWVSRMIMLGIFRTGKIPFKDVYLHGTVKASDGQKMSKSKGNVITLDDLVGEFGADAIRMLYIVGNKAGASYRIDRDKLAGNRNFLNKVWNASRYVFFATSGLEKPWEMNREELAFTEDDKKVLAEVENLAFQVEKKIKNFRFGLVAVDLIQSFWHTFCDLYIEQVKGRLYTKDKEGNPINTSEKEIISRKAGQWTLWYVLGAYLKMLHPYIPFITEYLWESYPKAPTESETIMYATWPEGKEAAKAE
ncbi:valine--tRNA ligase [bacterium]|nr:valine--tRNA ligase [bacterium]